jgi:uncharacterized protein (TIGR00369 family)
MTDLAVPDGFEPCTGPLGPFMSSLGGLHQRPGPDGTLCLGLRLLPSHANIQGNAHGGMLVTLVDAALGINLGRLRTPPQSQVTVSLNTDFVSPGRIGDWLEAHVTVRKIGRRLAFGDCLLQAGERLVLHASGVFSVVEARGHSTAATTDG